MNRAKPLVPALVIIAAVVLAWSGSLFSPFVFDDHASIAANSSIRDLASLDWMRPPSTAGETVSGRPVLNFSLAVNYAFGGLDVRSYRAVNIAIHIAAALALFGIVRRTTVGDPDDRNLAAASVALLWALHPLQTGAVTYVVQRAESLCGMLMLLTLYCFIRGSAAGGSRLWMPMAMAACLLAAGTKEAAAVIPVLVLLYDRTFLSGSFREALRLRWRTHAALAFSWVILAALVAANPGRGGSAGFGAEIGPWTYIITQAGAIVRYLQLALWPSGLVFDYGVPTVAAVSVVLPQLFLLAALAAATVWALARRRVVGFAGAWFFLCLAPSSSVIPVATQTMAEHRMYLPLAAVTVLAVLGASRVMRGVRSRWAAVAILSVVAVALGAATIARNRDYASNLALWQDTASKRPANPRAQHNLGLALAAAGRVDEAIARFESAIELQPNHAFARFGLATLLAEKGRTAEAELHYRAAVAADPGHSDARVGLAALLIASGRAVEAQEHLRAAIASHPDFGEAHFHLGRAIEATSGDPRAAEESYRVAIRLDPAMAGAHLALGNMLAARGDAEAAERCVREAVRLDANLAGARFALGNILAAQRRFDSAMSEYREALRMDPDRVDALANLGNCLLVTGRFREAVATYEQALRLRPGDESVRENLRLARELDREGSPRGN